MKAGRKLRTSGDPVVSDINITPMVDVLLCLLILQMVIQPGLQKGLNVQLPLPERTQSSPTAAGGVRDRIVLRVTEGPTYSLNEVAVPAGDLDRTLRHVFRDRARKVLFVDAAEDVRYEEVIHAVDVARGAGLAVIGLVPRPIPPAGPFTRQPGPPVRHYPTRSNQ